MSTLGVVIVDHGSLRAESNDLLLQVVEAFKRQTGMAIVEPAHMELAEPSIGDAFDAAVAAGASTVVVTPFFLAPGRHIQDDIPRLAAEAAACHPGIEYQVSEPLGAHPALINALASRLDEAVRRTSQA